MSRQSLRAWILEALTDAEKNGPCTGLICLHTIGSAKKEIHNVKLNAGKQWTPDELAQLFESKAKSYAQDLPGTQLFEIEGFYGDRSTPEAFHPFRIEGETMYAMGGTDAPDGKGLVQQSMRHTEAMTSLAYAALAENNRLLNQMVQQFGDALIDSRKAELDAVGLVKDLVLERQNNVHAHRMEQLQFERQTTERRKWLQFAPPLINTLLGKDIFPQNTEDTALIEGLCENLTEEHIKKLAGALPPEYMGPLAARIEKFLEKKKAERSEDRRLLGNGLDPEADAAGDMPGEGEHVGHA
jgi:hypothetical protein